MIKKFQSLWAPVAIAIAFFIEPLIKSIIPTQSVITSYIRTGAFLIVFVCFWIVDKWLKKIYKDNRDFDYKVFYDGRDTEGKDEEAPVLILSECLKDVQNTLAHREMRFVKDPELVKEAEKLLSEKAILSQLIYKATSSDSATHEPAKYIIQCLFVPIDKNGKTLLIRRKKENHGSIFFGSTLGNVSFISFSPVPNHYNENFIADDAYHREVYDNPRFHKEISPFAVSMRRNISGNNYLFLIYKVKYEVEFNEETIPKIFGERDSEGNLKKGCFFQKNHDYIEGSIDFKDLNDLKIREWHFSLNALLECNFKEIFSHEYFVSDVEKEIIKSILAEQKIRYNQEQNHERS